MGRNKESPDWTGGYISKWAKDQFGRRSLSIPVRDFKIGVPRKGETLDDTLTRDLITLRAELPEHTPDLVVGYTSFQRLTPISFDEDEKDPLFRLPRYDPITGAVFTTRQQTPSLIFTEEGKKAFRDTTNLVVLRKPSHIEEVDLTRIPKSWTVRMIVPQENWGGLTSAARQIDEVGDAVRGRGVELARIQALYTLASRISGKYTVGKIDEVSLPELKDEVLNNLNSQGFLTARNPDLIDLEKDLERALDIGQRNPPAAKLVIFKAMRDLTAREVQTWFIRRRARKVFRELYGEWEKEKFNMVAIRELIIELGRHVLWRRRRISDIEINEARNLIKQIKEVAREVKTAPFLLPARLAEAIIRSNQFRSKREMKELNRILEVGRVESEVGRASVEDLIMRRDTKGFVRLRHAYGVINSALQDPDNHELTVFV